jgi:hypothetical protein
VNLKYTKYSTEQLEVIFTHLNDPAEKELVKEELSRRYYQHYLNIGNSAGDRLQSEPEAVPLEADGSEEALSVQEGQGEGFPVDNGELSDIREIAPIALKTSPGAEPAQPAEKPAKKKYCFIATAAYGSPLAQEVLILQGFRDKYLAKNRLGGACIRAYYRCSPPLADMIEARQILQLFVRCLLTPVILLIKKTTDNLTIH